jgi:hypothetical protein
VLWAHLSRLCGGKGSQNSAVIGLVSWFVARGICIDDKAKIEIVAGQHLQVGRLGAMRNVCCDGDKSSFCANGGFSGFEGHTYGS